MTDGEKKAINRLYDVTHLTNGEHTEYIDIDNIATEEEYLDSCEGFCKATDIVLNLIEKQSKEIEELNEDNQRYKRIASQKLDDIEEFRKNECEHRCIRNAEVLELKEYYQENYTPNDKIKAKIEEWQKEKEFYNKDEDREWGQFNNWDWINTFINEMQSLLEKE